MAGKTKTKATKAKTGAKVSKTVRAKHSRTPKMVATQKTAKGLDLIRKIAMRTPAGKIDDFRAGDTVNVYVKVKEGEKERIQLYKGVVTKIQGAGPSKSFTVRKISSGVGVERTFPYLSPALDRVELTNIGRVRRSRLYYLRELEGKAAKIQSELAVNEETEAAPVKSAEAETEAAKSAE